MFDFRFEIWVEPGRTQVVLLNRHPLSGFTDDGSENLFSLARVSFQTGRRTQRPVV